MTNPTSDPRDTTVDEILTKHITDFNIRDSGGMEDGRNVRLCNTEAKAALDAYYQAKFEKDMSEIIGKDNLNRWGGTLDISTREVNRNTLRKEQRKRANEKGYKL